jgi:hypothetical protein
MSASDPSAEAVDEVRWNPDFDALDQSLAEVYAALNELQESHRRKRNASWLHCLCGLLCGGLFALIALAIEKSTEIAWVVFAVFVIAVVIYLSVRLGGFRSTYRNLYKNEVFRRITSAIAPGVTYQPHHCVAQSFFEECGLHSSSIDRYSGEDFFSGSVGSTGVLFSELHVERKDTSRDSKGNTSTRWVTVFRGLFVVMDFHKDFRGETRIVTDVAESMFGWLGRKLQNISGDLVRLENPAFEKAFKVRSTDQVEARYLLTPTMQEQLLQLRETWGHGIQFCLRRSLLFISIPRSDHWFEIESRKGSSHRSVVQQFAAQLLAVLDMVRVLDLNTRIWTKE